MRTMIAVLIFCVPIPVFAQTASASCRIDATPLDFGQYSVLDPIPSTTIGRVEINCAPARVLGERVTLSTGSSGLALDRRMLRGADTLRYNLYADPAHHVVLGDGTAGTVTLTSVTHDLERSKVYRIYGAIPPRQPVPAGDYSDILVITVEF